MPPIPLPQALDFAMQAHRAGRLAEAEAIYRQILAVEPNHADALHLLGLIAHQVGSHEIAVDLIRRAIARNPAAADFHNDLGNALQGLGRLEDAIAAYQQALQLRPDLTATHNNLGNAFRAQRRIEDAIIEFRRALAQQPDLAEVHNNLGTALQDQGRIDEAIAAFHRAIQCNPHYAMPHNNLGNALTGLHQLDAAIAAYRRALELAPDFPLALNNLGSALRAHGRLDEAVAACRRAVRLQPDLAMAHNNLGNALKDQGQFDEALACYQQALRAQPAAADIHSNLLASLHDSPQTTLAALFDAHCEYDRRHAAPFRAFWQPHRNAPDPNRPLRLGFVSPHFSSHPVGHFLIALLEKLDTRHFQIVCYSDSLENDEMTARIQATAAVWQVVAGIDDERLAQQIRDDRVDILFDLAGHTCGNRLLVFARKPAPIQITWLDYVGTTGLTAIDYILADPHQIPPEAEPFYREKVLRMPDDYICYTPPRNAPAVNPLPALDSGAVTFGSFNVLAKITPQIIGIWANILHQVPQSRLILKNRGLDGPETSARLRQLFAGHGIGADCVELLGRSTPAEVLATYQRLDIALDTFPYNGGLTTCEALWMGVPVVTCTGETFASRHGLAHLSAVGLTETVASNLDQYVDTAVALARDLPRLADLRAGLRAQVAASPLCDGQRFADHLTTLLREAWRHWCASV